MSNMRDVVQTLCDRADLDTAVETAVAIERESIAVMLDRMALECRRRFDDREVNNDTIRYQDTIEGIAYVNAAGAVRARGRT